MALNAKSGFLASISTKFNYTLNQIEWNQYDKNSQDKHQFSGIC